MSDQHGGSGDNPSGQQPPNPYSPPPYNPPPSAPNPYGQQPPSAPNPYGQQPQPAQPTSYREKYGEQVSPQEVYPSGYAAHGYGVPDPRPLKRPGTVTAASVITLAFSGLSAVLYGIVLVGLVVARQDVVDAIEDEMRGTNGLEDITAGDLATGLAVVIAVLLIWTLAACLLAILVLRRSNIARILLVISSGFTAAFSLLGITSGISAITLIASVAVIVLLFVGGAGDWFRGRKPPTPGGPVLGMTQY